MAETKTASKCVRSGSGTPPGSCAELDSVSVVGLHSTQNIDAFMWIPARSRAQIRRKSRFSCVVVHFTASLGLSEEKIKEIEEEFAAIDEDGDGEVRRPACCSLCLRQTIM